ncbi:MAG TPA: DUF2079 domain-containing protein, partial [Polyangiaceae bacterium]|nr:DUF2079 domain-containing protein [Polyangiaceae bacterium]
MLSRLTATLGLAILEASSMGFAGWALADRRYVPAYVHDNVLSQGARRMIFVNVAGALAVAWVVLLALLVLKRRRMWLDAAERTVRRAAPLSLAALAVLLFDHRLWDGRDLAFLTLALGWGFGVRVALRTAVETAPVFPTLAARVLPASRAVGAALGRAASRVDAPLGSVIAASCAYATYLSVISIAQHRNLETSAFDMGGWDNLMWNLVHRGAIFESTPFMGTAGSHLARHATFFAYVLAPFYAMSPGPETLLVLQAVILGWAAVPLHLYARLHLPAWS